MSDKYDRHIQLINYLMKSGRVIYENLAAHFEVSIKTIKKDINELSLYFPLIPYVGRGGGVEIGKFVINGYILSKKYIELICEGLNLLKQKKSSNEIDFLLSYFDFEK